MKQKDILLIAVIVFFSTIISLVVSRSIFTSDNNRHQQVEVVHAISSNFTQPDQRYFNNTAFDPAKQITIGQESNPAPFSSTQQPH